MAEPKIRRANSNDFDQVLSMYLVASKELKTPAPDDQDIDAIREEIECFYVADLDGLLLSQRMIIHDYPIRYRDAEGSHDIEGAFMGNAYTLPEHRRKGLSTRVFQAIEADARDQGIDALYVSAEGPGMEEWWKHRGAEALGVCESCWRAEKGCEKPLLVKRL